MHILHRHPPAEAVPHDAYWAPPFPDQSQPRQRPDHVERAGLERVGPAEAARATQRRLGRSRAMTSEVKEEGRKRRIGLRETLGRSAEIFAAPEETV